MTMIQTKQFVGSFFGSSGEVKATVAAQHSTTLAPLCSLLFMVIQPTHCGRQAKTKLTRAQKARHERSRPSATADGITTTMR